MTLQIKNIEDNASTSEQWLVGSHTQYRELTKYMLDLVSTASQMALS